MDTPEARPAPAALDAPLELRCGLTLRNRLCKAATSEHLGTPRTNDATPRLVRLYERWGAGGFGLIITGNVMVCRCALEAPRNVVVDAATDGAAVAAWAAAARRRGAVAIAQLSHPGRQSPVAASWARPRAPSAVPLRLAGVGPPLHRSPVAMAPAEVEEVVEAFGACAGRCAALGFDGVQVHAAHGYLLSQFLSPRGNARRDAYGGDAARRARAVVLACRAARRAMGPGKLLAVKVNASDFEVGGFDSDGAAAVVRALAADEARVDVIELSGGTYASGMACLGDARDFAGADARGALFATLARDLRGHARGVAVMLTGGVGSADAAARALGAADLVGVCRAACVDADVARRWLAGDGGAPPAPAPVPRRAPPALRRLLVPGLNYGWYQRQLQRLAADLPAADLSHLPFLCVALPRALLFEPARLSPRNAAALGALFVAAAAATRRFSRRTE